MISKKFTHSAKLQFNKKQVSGGRRHKQFDENVKSGPRSLRQNNKMQFPVKPSVINPRNRSANRRNIKDKNLNFKKTNKPFYKRPFFPLTTRRNNRRAYSPRLRHFAAPAMKNRSKSKLSARRKMRRRFLLNFVRRRPLVGHPFEFDYTKLLRKIKYASAGLSNLPDTLPQNEYLYVPAYLRSTIYSFFWKYLSHFPPHLSLKNSNRKLTNRMARDLPIKYSRLPRSLASFDMEVDSTEQLVFNYTKLAGRALWRRKRRYKLKISSLYKRLNFKNRRRRWLRRPQIDRSIIPKIIQNSAAMRARRRGMYHVRRVWRIERAIRKIRTFRPRFQRGAAEDVYTSGLLFKMFTVAAMRLMRTFFVSARRGIARLPSRGLNRSRGSILNSILASARTLVAHRLMRALLLHQTPLRSPIVSLFHLLWLNGVIKEARTFFKKQKNKIFIPFSSSVTNSLLTSRKMFFNPAANARRPSLNKRVGFANWHYYFYARSAGRPSVAMKYWNRHWRKYIRAERTTFVVNRNARQSGEFALMQLDNRPFWALNSARVDGRYQIYLSMWEYRIRQVVLRRFLINLDPFTKLSRLYGVRVLNPFAPLDQLPNTAQSVRIAGRYFFSSFISLYAGLRAGNQSLLLGNIVSPFEDSGKITFAKVTNESFYVLLKYFMKTTAREQRSILADFAVTWQGLGSVRKWRRPLRADGRSFDKRLRSKKWNYPEVRSIPFYLANRGVNFKTWFEKNWLLDDEKVSAEAIGNVRVRFLSDGRSPRMHYESLSVPRRFTFLGDLKRTSFSSYYSCNAGSLLKMLTDCANLISASPKIPNMGNETMFNLVKNVADLLRIRAGLAAYRRKGGAAAFRSAQWVPANKVVARNYFFSSYKYMSVLREFKVSGANKIFKTAYALWKKSAQRAFVSGRDTWEITRSLNFIGVKSEKRAGLYKKSFVLHLNYVIGVYRQLRVMHYRVIRQFQRNFGPKKYPIRRFNPSLGLLFRATFNLKNLLKLKTALSQSREYLYSTRDGRVLRHPKYDPEINPLALLRRPAGSAGMKISANAKRQEFMFRYVLTRRVKDIMILATGARRRGLRGLSAGLENVFSKLLFTRKKRKKLLKINPDTRGRSRIFYFPQKNNWRGRKFNKNYRLIRTFQPPRNLKSEKIGEYTVNKHLKKTYRGKMNKRNIFRLKAVIRHIFRRRWRCSSNRLLAKWLYFRQTKNKWLTLYHCWEGMLSNYLVLVRLLPRKWTKHFIARGLITINGVRCVNEDYVVKPGDIIVLNNEAYWTLLARRTAKRLKRAFTLNAPAGPAKRRLLNWALKKLRRSYARGNITAAVHVREKKMLQNAVKVFLEDPILKHLPRKPLAPGGPNVGKEEVFNSDTSQLGLLPSDKKYTQNKFKYKRMLTRLLNDIDKSREFNGRFFYRFHNAVMAIRVPSSPAEMFSVSKARKSALYNPRIIKYFYSHRFWH